MKKKINPVVHFETPVDDSERMSSFYNKVFGWQTNDLGEEMGNYVLVATSEMDDKGRPKGAGMINRGFYQRIEGSPPYPTFVIGVEDIKETIIKIKDAGGKVLEEPITIPGFGLYLSFIDTENNRISVMQPFNGMM